MNRTMANQEEALKQIKEKFEGKWKANKNENIEEFYRELGMNIVFRKIAAQLHPDCDILVEGSEVKIAYKLFFKAENMTFKYGGETEFTTSQGNMKGKMSYEGGKFTTSQTPADGNTDGKAIEIIREINEAGELTATLKIGETTAKRIFQKLPKTE